MHAPLVAAHGLNLHARLAADPSTDAPIIAAPILAKELVVAVCEKPRNGRARNMSHTMLLEVSVKLLPHLHLHILLLCPAARFACGRATQAPTSSSSRFRGSWVAFRAPLALPSFRTWMLPPLVGPLVRPVLVGPPLRIPRLEVLALFTVLLRMKELQDLGVPRRHRPTAQTEPKRRKLDLLHLLLLTTDLAPDELAVERHRSKATVGFSHAVNPFEVCFLIYLLRELVVCFGLAVRLGPITWLSFCVQQLVHLRQHFRLQVPLGEDTCHLLCLLCLGFLGLLRFQVLSLWVFGLLLAAGFAGGLHLQSRIAFLDHLWVWHQQTVTKLGGLEGQRLFKAPEALHGGQALA
mmetsp:Transcript_29325/g.69149  ORF Transcript_29325/g.69149 Transcript_29325/m.69149 type:complete len:350 (-) Transcript_29325:1796-2845(-)